MVKEPPARPAAAEVRRLELQRKIGVGGYGEVWRGALVSAGGVRVTVAVKLLHRGLDDEAVARRLRDEARILGLIQHPGVVKVIELVELEGRWAVVMEYVDGLDLEQALRGGAVPPWVALSITSEVARVLEAARGTPGADEKPIELVHRDIKPSNIKITPAGAVKVLDFGVARARFEAKESKTSQGTFGTVPYMSPERLAWEDGPEGDIYALGAVLFELILGEPLGRTTTLQDRHERKLAEAEARLRPRLPSPDPGLGPLLMQMLAFDPAARPDARQVEDRCDALALALGDGRLKRWAEQEVPRRARASEAPPGDAGPLSWSERGDGVFRSPAPQPDPGPAPTLPERPTRRRWIAVTGALLLGLGLLLGLSLRPPPAAPAPAPSGPSLEAGAPATQPAAQPAAQPATPSEPAAGPRSPASDPPPVAASPAPSATNSTQTSTPSSKTNAAPPRVNASAAPSSAPAVAAPEPEPEPEPGARVEAAPPSTGQVLIQVRNGEAQVWLTPVGGGPSYSSGEVPPGRYVVNVRFEGGDVIEALTLKVEAGATEQVLCDARFANCKR